MDYAVHEENRMKQQTNRNRRWVLASRPHGARRRAMQLRLEEDDVATPGEGQVLLRTCSLSLTLICVAA